MGLRSLKHQGVRSSVGLLKPGTKQCQSQDNRNRIRAKHSAGWPVPRKSTWHRHVCHATRAEDQVCRLANIGCRINGPVDGGQKPQAGITLKDCLQGHASQPVYV